MPDYAPGAPLWVDVSSPDLATTRTFYRGLFGWDDRVIPDPGAGGYTTFFKNGKMVSGAGPTFGPDQHPAWSTYFASTDADATAQRVIDAGGEVVAPPMDVIDQGRMAVLKDPTGAHFSIWQPRAHAGAELVNEPGSFSWNELYTRDMPAAREFYKNVFGWDAAETEVSFGTYTVFTLGGKGIAGGIDMSNLLPDSVPPHWLVYFSVEDAHSAVLRAKELGGTVLAGPEPTPMGPTAVMADPVGAPFAVVQFTSER